MTAEDSLETGSETKSGNNCKEDGLLGRRLLKSMARPEGFEPPPSDPKNVAAVALNDSEIISP
jgi:hypothetical protein